MDLGEHSSTKTDWGNLPYPVIHAIAKSDLQNIKVYKSYSIIKRGHAELALLSLGGRGPRSCPMFKKSSFFGHFSLSIVFWST